MRTAGARGAEGAGGVMGETMKGGGDGARRRHPGELATKVGYFGVKSAKVCRAQMGTKPAKVGRLGPRCAKVRRGLHPAPTTGASAKKVFDPRREQSC
jgi:hypothetical protein